MKILVTGADGFIGSHLIEKLVRSGHTVRAFVMYNSFSNWGWLESCPKEVKEKIEIHLGDIRDQQNVMQAVNGCTHVAHLAALIAIPYSYVSPESYVQTNINGTLNMLLAAREHKVSRFIQTSTSEVYGSAQSVPINENHRLLGQSPYSASKIAADQIAYSFYASYGVPVITLRPFNTYGPRQSARAVIPTIIGQVSSGIRRIRLGSTNPTRDFNYVDDVTDAFIAALTSDRGVGEVINIGSNYEISIAETVALIGKLMQVKIDIESEPSRTRPDKSEVVRLWADNSKAKALLGWEPRHAGLTGFALGLEKTIDWFSDPKNLCLYKSSIYNV